jgi:hypothetical protein
MNTNPIAFCHVLSATPRAPREMMDKRPGTGIRGCRAREEHQAVGDRWQPGTDEPVSWQ